MTFTPDQMAALSVIVGFGLLASIGANVALMVRVFRRSPPIDQTLQDYTRKPDLESLAKNAEATYARRSEFEVFRADMQRSCAATHARADKTFGAIFDIQRALVKEVTDRLDRNHASLNEWQRGIERQIGRLEADNNKGVKPR